jgi:hypothetical protein
MKCNYDAISSMPQFLCFHALSSRSSGPVSVIRQPCRSGELHAFEQASSGKLQGRRKFPHVRLRFAGFMIKSKIDCWQVDVLAVRPSVDTPTEVLAQFAFDLAAAARGKNTGLSSRKP